MSDTRAATRRRYEIGGWVLVLVLALALLSWRVSGDGGSAAALHPVDIDPPSGPHAEIGAVLLSEQAGPAPDAHNLSVRVPIGTVHITVQTPAMRVTDGNDDEYRPPRGGSFVQVDSQLDSSTADIPVTTLVDEDGRVTVALVARGHRYPFGRLLHATSATTSGDVVAVPGTGRHDQVAVTYRGVTQIVDVDSGRRSTGRAAPLYRAAPGGATGCGPARVERPFTVPSSTYGSTCRLDWRRVPFVSGPGWARPGTSWLLLSIHNTGPGQLRRAGPAGSALYQTSRSDGRTSVRCADGRAAVTAGRPPDGPRNRDGVTVLACVADDAAAQRLVVTERLQVFAYGAEYGSGKSVDVTWSPSAG